MRTTLPWRLRIFQHFPTRPEMVKLKKVSSHDFPMPRVRSSFTRQFFDVTENELKLMLANVPVRRNEGFSLKLAM